MSLGPGSLLALAANPLQLAVTALSATVLLLGMWWALVQLLRRPVRRLFWLAISLHLFGSVCVLVPIIAISAQTIWPSLFVMAQLAAFGAGLIGLIVFSTGIALVWVALAAIIDRL